MLLCLVAAVLVLRSTVLLARCKILGAMLTPYSILQQPVCVCLSVCLCVSVFVFPAVSVSTSAPFLFLHP